MAYARAGKHSDLYIFSSIKGLICCGCKLEAGSWFTAKDKYDMLEHIKEHKTAGHKVPYRLTAKILEDHVESG